ncbi:MAG: hypothetical protein DRJ38_08550 [Thermoprotei archaeon]|nr:MAG: hypothetical protein DRJ38_08550 [Thermoprotei archaeon]
MLILILAFIAGMLLGFASKKEIKIDPILSATVAAIVFYIGLEIGKSQAIFNIDLLIISLVLSLLTIIFSVLLAYMLTRGGIICST